MHQDGAGMSWVVQGGFLAWIHQNSSPQAPKGAVSVSMSRLSPAGDGDQENAAPNASPGAVPALPRPLESIREQFGLEIAGRELSRAGQTSNNAERLETGLGQSSAGTGRIPGRAAGGAAPGRSGVSSFLLPPRIFQGLWKE